MSAQDILPREMHATKMSFSPSFVWSLVSRSIWYTKLEESILAEQVPGQLVVKFNSIFELEVPSLSTKRCAIRGVLIPHPLRSYKLSRFPLPSQNKPASTASPVLSGENSDNELNTPVLNPIGDSEDPAVSLQLNGPSQQLSGQHSLPDADTFGLQPFRDFDRLPVILLLHGLGGQVSQFEGLLNVFSQFADVVGIDLPGCGLSRPAWKMPGYKYDRSLRHWPAEEEKKFLVNDKLTFEDYSSDRLVDILFEFLQYEAGGDPEAVSLKGREVIIVGHSMGSNLAVKLGNRLGKLCKGVIAICPPIELKEDARKKIQMLRKLPTFVFDTFRILDRYNGLDSPSVERMLSASSCRDTTLKQTQMRWNLDVDSQVWVKVANGFVPASREEWESVYRLVASNGGRLYVLGATEDLVTPCKNVDIIKSWLEPLEVDSSVLEVKKVHDAGHAVMLEKPSLVAGLVSEVIERIVPILSQSWVLRYKAEYGDGKWSLKNEAKWKKLIPVSKPIALGDKKSPFRAMKTLRQTDEEHNPVKFEEKYPEVTDVIDISSWDPPYDPSTFRRVRYHKFATVSKIPPSESTVKKFIALVDGILTEHKDSVGQIVVHCHYGFNRTGFLICCYLIERLNFSVDEAIEAFRLAREPGIKHVHFIDVLHVRYES